MDLDQLWQLALGEMEVQLSRANFATWLKSSRLVDKNDGTFTIALPNHFAKEWVQTAGRPRFFPQRRQPDGGARADSILRAARLAVH